MTTAAVAAQLATDEGLTASQWAALPPAIRISHLLVDTIITLSMIREELQTELASPLLWMENDVAAAFETADRILQRLDA
jgi:hypothetical protein